jgi:hypothetical protein
LEDHVASIFRVEEAKNKHETRSKQSILATYFHAGFFLDFFFDPEDGGDMSFRNVC